MDHTIDLECVCINLARSSRWARATASGLLKTLKLGASEKRGDLLALVDDPLGDNQAEIKAPLHLGTP